MKLLEFEPGKTDILAHSLNMSQCECNVVFELEYMLLCDGMVAKALQQSVPSFAYIDLISFPMKEIIPQTMTESLGEFLDTH